MNFQRFVLLALTAATWPACVARGGGESVSIEHSIAAIEEGRFHGWPANNGVWQWGDEILVGFTQGPGGCPLRS